MASTPPKSCLKQTKSPVPQKSVSFPARPIFSCADYKKHNPPSKISVLLYLDDEPGARLRRGESIDTKRQDSATMHEKKPRLASLDSWSTWSADCDEALNEALDEVLDEKHEGADDESVTMDAETDTQEKDEREVELPPPVVEQAVESVEPIASRPPSSLARPGITTSRFSKAISRDMLNRLAFSVTSDYSQMRLRSKECHLCGHSRYRNKETPDREARHNCLREGCCRHHCRKVGGSRPQPRDEAKELPGGVMSFWDFIAEPDEKFASPFLKIVHGHSIKFYVAAYERYCASFGIPMLIRYPPQWEHIKSGGIRFGKAEKYEDFIEIESFWNFLESERAMCFKEDKGPKPWELLKVPPLDFLHWLWQTMAKEDYAGVKNYLNRDKIICTRMQLPPEADRMAPCYFPRNMKDKTIGNTFERFESRIGKNIYATRWKEWASSEVVFVRWLWNVIKEERKLPYCGCLHYIKKIHEANANRNRSGILFEILEEHTREYDAMLLASQQRD